MPSLLSAPLEVGPQKLRLVNREESEPGLLSTDSVFASAERGPSDLISLSEMRGSQRGWLQSGLQLEGTLQAAAGRSCQTDQQTLAPSLDCLSQPRSQVRYQHGYTSFSLCAE